MSRTVLTIGYEGRSSKEIFDALVGAGVQTLLDVRWTSRSRKAGFAKSGLLSACSAAGIEYSHDRRLGTPPEILRTVRETGVYDWEQYTEFLLSQDDALQGLYERVEGRRTALLCFESSPVDCHRSVVADTAAAELGLSILHL